MKYFKLIRLLSLALIGGLSALSASTVFAAAGETITNEVSLNYSVGGVAQTAVTDSVDFVEDNLVNFTVTWTQGNQSAVPGSSGNMLTYIVTNLSNGALDFSVAAVNAAALTDDFNVDSIDSVFVESGLTPGYQLLEDTATFIDELSNDTTGSANVTQVYVFSTMPAGQPNGDLANITLTATARAGDVAGATGAMGAVLTDDGAAADNTTLEQTVLNDPAGLVDVVQDGLNSVNGTYIIAAANLTVSKVVTTIWDPINADTNPKAIPGAYVQYVITVANAVGGSSADLTTLGDTLVTTLLDPNLVISTVADATAPTVAETEHGATLGFGIKVVVTGSGRTATTLFCTGDTAADTDTDGCSYPGDAPVINSAVGINLGTLLVAEDIAPAGVGTEDYAVGELKAGETVTITFNAIVQ